MKYFTITLLFLSFTYGAQAQIELVKDINPIGDGIYGNELVVYKNEMYFSGDDNITSNELWKSDGTEEGTVLVRDLVNSGGLYPYELTIAGEYLYFSGRTDQGTYELYRSDGTEAGTVLVVDQREGLYDPDIRNLVAVGDKLFFTSTDGMNGADGTTGNELYVVEGTNTPVRLSDFKSGPANSSIMQMSAFRGLLFFSTESDVDGVGRELYVSDGTPSGTKLFKDIYPGEGYSSNPHGFSVIGETMYFTAGDEAGIEPWVSDGTPEGTYRLTDLNSGANSSNPKNYTGSIPGRVFFHADDGITGAELFFTDGTEEGTIPLKDIWTGGKAELNSFFPTDEGVYFAGMEKATFNIELWYSDGTPSGTSMIVDLNEGGMFYQEDKIFWFNGVLYFAGDDGSFGEEVWAATDNSDSATLVQDYYPGYLSSYPVCFTEMNDSIYFFSEDLHGKELRKMPQLHVDDPCDGILCPVGEVCYEGSCYNPGNKTAGTIKDAVTGMPLEGAEIILMQGSDTIQILYGDNNGMYSFYYDYNDNTTLLVSLEPYISSSRNIYSMNLFNNFDILLSVDPCFEINCPVGEVCYDGTCYKPVSPIHGVVYDQNNNTVAGARLEDLYRDNVTYTDENGNFTIDSLWESVVILKEGYSPRYEHINSQSELEIFLNFDPCYTSSCDNGQVCVGGKCFEPYDTIFATFSLYDESGNEILSSIEVTERGTNNTYIADGYTEFPVVTRNPHFIFHDPEGNYRDAILPFIAGKEVYYLEDPYINCDDLNCPAGDVCYDGACFTPLSNNQSKDKITGYVLSNDSLVLPYATVLSDLSDPAMTDLNGYFEIELLYMTDSLTLRIEKPGYGSVSVVCYPDENNIIYTTLQDACYNIDCPEGYFCFDGQCISSENAYGAAEPDPCKDVWCPVGEVCYDGNCYHPCVFDPKSCEPPEADPCADVWCPVGQVCYLGSCYDPCVDSQNTRSEICNDYADPCDNATVPPGYICSNGTFLPDSPNATDAWKVTDLCSMIRCAPGESCFQCNDETGYNYSGSSVLTGSLNLDVLKSAETYTGYSNYGEANSSITKSLEKTQTGGVFIYLLDAETNRKVAIDLTDSAGYFHFENIPSADYRLFVIIPGYLMTAEDQMITVENDQELDIDISAENEFLKVSVTDITSAPISRQNSQTYWYPTPNREGRFFMDRTGILEEVKVYNAMGAEMGIQIIGSSSPGTKELFIDQPFNPGVYFIRWKTEKDSHVYSQVLLLQ